MEIVIADTTQGYRVLETSHPPTYYFPPMDVQTSLLKTSLNRRTMCEWKGELRLRFRKLLPVLDFNPVA